MIKKCTILLALLTSASLFAQAQESPITGLLNTPGLSFEFETLWDQGFETGTESWRDISVEPGRGRIEQVSSGTNDITSSAGDSHALVTISNVYSYFDGKHSEWTGNWIAELDVYLDPAWTDGEGFSYAVATTGADGWFQQDYSISISKYDGKLVFGGGPGGYFYIRDDLEAYNHYVIDQAGWYTLQHVFYERDGALAVDLNLVDRSGTILFSDTHWLASETIPQEVGGNRYSAFWFLNVAGGLAIDNHQRFNLFSQEIPETPFALKESALLDLGGALAGIEDIDACLAEAAAHIAKSLGIDEERIIWTDEDHVELKHGNKVFDEDKKTIKILQAIINNEAASEDIQTLCQTVIDKLLTAAHMLSTTALDDASAVLETQTTTLHPRILAGIERQFTKCEIALEIVVKTIEEGKAPQAIDRYKSIWIHAQLIEKFLDFTEKSKNKIKNKGKNKK